MKKSIFIAALVLLSSCLYAQTGSISPACLSKADAENIMGQPGNITESKTETKNGIVQIRCTYTATNIDSKTGKRGNIYYMAEEYPSAEQAHDTLASYKYSNRNSPGWRNLPGFGDEAIAHTDKKNFQLVIIRKGNKMVRMKVNKVTAFTAPLETLLSVGERIANTF